MKENYQSYMYSTFELKYGKVIEECFLLVVALLTSR